MKRLIDDPQIAGELRTEMQRYATEQAQVDLKRVYTGMSESLQLTAAPSSAPQARVSGSTWSGLSSVTKLLLVAAIGGTVALGVNTLGGAGHEAAPSTESPTEPTRSERSANAAAALPSSGSQPSGAANAPSSALASRQAAALQPELVEPPTAAAPDPAPKNSAGRGNASSASRREIAQLARIKALLEQDPAAARRLIRAAQREFPAGLLVEEREGLDAIALFELKEIVRARRNAERFIARYPQSPLRPKLERLIADASE